MVDTNTQKRTPRALETREHDARPQTWKPASTLPVPLEQDGYKFRWIRRSMLGQEDPTNVSKKRREGWEPVTAQSQPKMRMFATQTGRFADSIQIGGLMLCKIPAEFMDQRRQMMTEWADYLDKLRQGADVIPLRQKA